MKRISRSRLILAVTLSATLLAAWFAPEQRQDEDVVLMRPAQSQSESPQSNMARNLFVRDVSRKTTAAEAVEVLRIKERQALEDDDVSLFAATDWRQPEALLPERIPLEDAPPPAPTAPPLSFRIMGRYTEGGQSAVFLQREEQSWAVREGDMLDGLYQVEYIGHDVVRLRYLPLDEVQTLSADDGAP
jgi:hypothetical protein